MKRLICVVCLVLTIQYVFAQAETEDLYEMSLEELMNIEIVSASKKKENVFDAPLASYTITGKEIRSSGANSIAEALRLCPDLIVREVSNGVYDVHVRGFDNMPRMTDGAFQTNQLTLVMIDDRPVFNHNMGAVYWENLPIEINDIERIEIVKGPAAPLFGPNAVTGVINIITKELAHQGFNASVDAQLGNAGSVITSANVGQNWDKFAINLSGNYQKREMYSDEYFEFRSGNYVKGGSNLRSTMGEPILKEALGDPGQSLDKYGVNLFTKFSLSDALEINFDAGIQEATTKRFYFNNDFTPVSETTFNSNYFNLAADYKGLKIRVSQSNGNDVLSKFVPFVSFEYEYSVNDMMLDYTWNISDKLSIQPGLNYQHAKYTGIASEGQASLIEGDKILETIAASMRFDYSPTDKLRLIAATRADKFSRPDKTYISYQFISTYNINDKNIVRAVYSKSNSSAFVGPTFLNVNLVYQVPGLPDGTFGTYQYKGEPNLKLFSLNLIELGYRVKLFSNLEADLTLFHQEGNDFYAVVYQPIPSGYEPLASNLLQMENLEMKGIQNGATLSLNWVPMANLQLKPFFTFQKSEIENLPTALRSPDLDPIQNTENVIDDTHYPTPDVFGGAYINYSWNKFNFNINPYFMSAYRVFNENDLIRGTLVGEIDNTFLLNAKISYSVLEKLSIYVNGRNLVGAGTNQHYGTAKTGTLLTGGLRLEL